MFLVDNNVFLVDILRGEGGRELESEFHHDISQSKGLMVGWRGDDRSVLKGLTIGAETFTTRHKCIRRYGGVYNHFPSHAAQKPHLGETWT